MNASFTIMFYFNHRPRILRLLFVLALVLASHAHKQVLLLDAQVGPFDEAIYRRVFSPRHRVLRAADLATIVAQHSPPTEVGALGQGCGSFIGRSLS